MTAASAHQYEPDDHQEPGVTIRPLTADDVADLFDHDYREREGDPACLRVTEPSPSTSSTTRSPSIGRAGASALANYHRRRQLELAAWRADLPAHVLLVVAVFVVSWSLGRALTGPLPNWLIWAPATAWAVWACHRHAR